MRRRDILLAWIVIGVTCGTALAQETREAPTPGDPALVGFWSGAIEVPGRSIPVSVDLAREGEAWAARIDVPDQAIRKVQMTGVDARGKAVSFGIPGVPGDPVFEGTLEGDAIAGDYTQGGQSIPFRLERAEKPDDYDVDLYAAYRKAGRRGEGAAGQWLGLLESGPHRFRMKLSLDSGESGYSGTLVSVDQRASSFPAEQIEIDGRQVSFAIPTIGASFRGTLADDGSELDGSWTQGGQGLPLVFRRAE